MILGNGKPTCPYCGKPILLGYPHEACVTEYSRFMEEASNAWEQNTPKNLTAQTEMDFENVKSMELIEYLEVIMENNGGCLILSQQASVKMVSWMRSMIVLAKDQGEFIRFLKEKRFEVLTKGAQNELE